MQEVDAKVDKLQQDLDALLVDLCSVLMTVMVMMMMMMLMMMLTMMMMQKIAGVTKIVSRLFNIGMHSCCCVQ